MQMKGYCKQLRNSDTVVFTIMGQSFLFSANTLTYFPITECAKDLLISGNFENQKIPEEIKSKYNQDEIEKTAFKLTEFRENNVISPIIHHEKGEIYYNDYYLKLVQSTRCNLNCSYCFAKKDKSMDMSVETAKKAGLNAIFFQVRPASDALYPSDIFPYSKYLTGQQGVFPESNFDCLGYLISVASKKEIAACTCPM